MSNYYLEQTWKSKPDEEIISAGSNPENFSKSVHPVILNELQRRGLPIPQALNTALASRPINSTPKNPLTSWAWTFMVLNAVFAVLLILSGKYHWYYFLGDLALLWFVVLWIKRSKIAAQVFLFNYTVSFFAYQMAYLMNILERPSPISWLVSIGLGLWAFWNVWNLQKQYLNYLVQQAATSNTLPRPNPALNSDPAANG